MQAVHLPSFAAPEFQGKTKAGPHGDFRHELDHLVGELMKTLAKLGVADNTLIIFSSDNGPETTSVAHRRADCSHDSPQRDYTLHQTIKLDLAIRRGEFASSGRRCGFFKIANFLCNE